jgi:multiple sugar transport system substrate-binding protein
VIPMPGATTSDVGAVNGSMGLGITANSQHPDEDWQYISYLTSQKVQNKYAKLSLPIWKSSYDDPAVQAGQTELVAAAKLALNGMLARPETASYPQLSNILQQNLQKVLQGNTDPASAMQQADRQLSRLR